MQLTLPACTFLKKESTAKLKQNSTKAAHLKHVVKPKNKQ